MMKIIVFFLIIVQLTYAIDWHTLTLDPENYNIEDTLKCVKDDKASPIIYHYKGYKISKRVDGSYTAEKDDLTVVIATTKKACEVIRNRFIIALQNEKAKQAKSYIHTNDKYSSSNRYITSWGNTDYSDSSYSWRKLNIKLNTGEYIWASLGKSGSCDNLLTSIGNASRCGGSYWSYSCRAGGQKTSGYRDSAEKMVEKIVEECN